MPAASLSHRWALAVAALTVAVPWLTYARFFLTEPDFYPVFLLFALALVRALENPTRRRQLLVAAALALTYLTRTQAIVLAGAVVVAVPIYGIAQAPICARRSERGRRPGRSTLPQSPVLVAGRGRRCLVARRPVSALDRRLAPSARPGDLGRRESERRCSSGLGVLVGVAAPLGVAMLLRRTASSSAAALAAVTVATTAALLASVSLLSESPYGQGTVHERDLFFAAPLVISCALAWATNGFPATESRHRRHCGRW